MHMKEGNDSRNNTQEGQNGAEGSRAPAPAPSGPATETQVSKTTLEDGAELTTVRHPPRYLKQPGEIKAALESGILNLDDFTDLVLEGCRATRLVAVGKGETTSEPDYPTRLKYLQFITETVEGMPIKRQEIVSKKLTTEEDLIAMAKKSPAFARGLMKSLEKVLSGEGGAE